MEMKIPIIAISAVIVVVVLAGVLMPVLSDSVATSDTYTNNGMYRMNKYATSDPVTLEWTYEDPTNVKVNGINIGLTSNSLGYSICVGENWILRTNGTSYMDLIDASGLVSEAKTSNSTTMIMDFNGGTLTTTVGESVTTLEYTDFYCIGLDGGYVYKGSNPVYLLGDTQAYGIHRIASQNALGINGIVVLDISGSIDNGFQASEITNHANLSLGEVQVTSEKISDHVNLYKLDGMSITATNTNNDKSSTYDWNALIVPYEITAEKSVHLSNNEIAIFLAIPVLIIVALLVGIVAAVMRRW